MTDFLARESELLGEEFTGTPTGGTYATAGGDIDFDRAASAFPDISLDGIGDIPAPALPAAPATSSGFSFEDFASPPRERQTEVKVTGDDEIEKFEDQFPDIEVPSSEPVFGAAPTFAPRPQPSAFTSTPILNHAAEEEEPEVIKQWRERQAEEIKERDEASKRKREETVSKAERAIDQFYEEYSAKKERNIRENKDLEEEFVAKMTDSLSNGTTWQRICDLIELQNSQSKTVARAGPGTTDLTRFKEVLLRLKREGDAAPGAAGY
ncbi:clathrin light chain [Rhodofomes roseus]|uniref:Clathrin light chain n=1 Tax=Rhodofomes roseus TaxID=34475 RepID=A0ABQ8KA49_9APHY|nr:clathrin light chain [Rhodofomes roseus]KAH9834143.1 clathrin light chain [Rhodofomes roseus]